MLILILVFWFFALNKLVHDKFGVIKYGCEECEDCKYVHCMGNFKHFQCYR